MDKKIKFTSLKSDESLKLIGGFSSAFNLTGVQDTTKKVNNCQGGNFKAGCGAGDSTKVKRPNTSPNKNCKGNCVKGCGGQK